MKKSIILTLILAAFAATAQAQSGGYRFTWDQSTSGVKVVSYRLFIAEKVTTTTLPENLRGTQIGSDIPVTNVLTEKTTNVTTDIGKPYIDIPSYALFSVELKALVTGRQYYVQVCAVSEAGVESERSIAILAGTSSALVYDFRKPPFGKVTAQPR